MIEMTNDEFGIGNPEGKCLLRLLRTTGLRVDTIRYLEYGDVAALNDGNGSDDQTR